MADQDVSKSIGLVITFPDLDESHVKYKVDDRQAWFVVDSNALFQAEEIEALQVPKT